MCYLKLCVNGVLLALLTRLLFREKKKRKKQAFLYLETFAIAPCGEIYRIMDFHPFICEHRKRILRKRCLVLGPNFPDPKCYNLEPQRTVYRHADSFRRHRRIEKSIVQSETVLFQFDNRFYWKYNRLLKIALHK